MIQELCGHQLLKIWKQMQRFVTCLDTVDPVTGRGNCTLYGRQLVQFFTKIWKEEDLCKVCSTQSHGWVGTCENFFQTCSHILNCSITGWVVCISECLWNKNQSIEWRIKSLPWPKEFHLQQMRIKTALSLLMSRVWIFAWWKNIEQWIQCRGPQKVNEGSFRNEATILRERQLVPFAQQCLYSSNVTVKCFLANWSMVEFSHPPYSPDCASQLFPFLKCENGLSKRRRY